MKLWITRDKNGALNLFEDKPFKNTTIHGLFESYSNDYFIDSELFPEVTWENSPQQVELKLCNTKNTAHQTLCKIEDAINEYDADNTGTLTEDDLLRNICSIVGSYFGELSRTKTD